MKRYVLILSILIFIGVVYPIKHASGLTFGYETQGGSSFGLGADAVGTSKGIPINGNGTVDTISFYARNQAYENKSIKIILFLNSDGTIITNGIGGTIIISSDTLTLYNVNYSIKPNVINNTNYLIGIISETGSNPVIVYDTGSAGDGGTQSNNYTTPTNLTLPLDYNNFKFTIYATYTPLDEEKIIPSPIFFE